MKSVLLALIAAYQRWVSPTLPVVTLGKCACRFAPSCSHYAAEAVATHGALRGAWLAVRRLVKCGPWHPGGYDPVPRCESVTVGTRGSDLRGRASRASLPSIHRATSSAAVQ